MMPQGNTSEPQKYKVQDLKVLFSPSRHSHQSKQQERKQHQYVNQASNPPITQHNQNPHDIHAMY